MNRQGSQSTFWGNPKNRVIVIAAGIVLLVGGLAIWAFRASIFQDKRSQESVLVMQSVLDTMQVESYFRDDFKRRDLHRQFIKFYTDRNYRLAWSTLRKPLPLADSLLQTLQMAYEDGLNPDDYNVKELQQMRDTVFKRTLLKLKYKKPDLLRLVQMDFQLTAAYLTYASHLVIGRLDPQKLESTWMINPQRSANLAASLNKALRTKKIRQSMLDLLPKRIDYQQLRQQLARYQQIKKKGGWPEVPPSDLYSIGKKGEAIVSLRKRLIISGDLSEAASADSTLFDETLQSAVKHFQERYGLNPTGKVEEKTLEAMNVPVDRRIKQIALNMERMRWLPQNLGDEYVAVNVPAFELKVMEKNRKALGMRVIVGEEFKSTPVFRDTMEYIVFSPEWAVPQSIATKEILPAVQRNPEYLLTHNYHVYGSWDSRDTIPLDPEAIDWESLSADNFTYRIVQDPGKSNSLGSIKFIFPNKMDIYLHDTPARYLFSRNERALSHGCVRVEQPSELAKYLLRDTKHWNDETIQEAMHLERQETVKLPHKVPVYLLYYTAYVDEQGRLNFRDDIYGHDSKQLSYIERKSTRL